MADGDDEKNASESSLEPFLRELYRRISADPDMQAVTVSEGLRLMAPEPLSHIFPGSWINANRMGSGEPGRSLLLK